MSEDSQKNMDYDIEDFTTKDELFAYIERKDERPSTAAVLGRFKMPPSLYDDIDMVIDLTFD